MRSSHSGQVAGRRAAAQVAATLAAAAAEHASLCCFARRYGVPSSDADGFEAVARERAYGPAAEQTKKEGGSEEEVRLD